MMLQKCLISCSFDRQIWENENEVLQNKCRSAYRGDAAWYVLSDSVRVCGGK